MAVSALQSVINYATSSNFTFDNTLIEFTGGLARLKNLQPNATLYVPFDTGFDGLYGGGVLTGTNSGGALTAGDGGKFDEGIDLRGGTVKYWRASAVGNADFTQTGTVSFFVKPGYSGTPAGVRYFFTICKDLVSSLNNLIEMYHDNSTGNIVLRIFNSSGSALFTTNIGAWSPVSGTWYHFEVNIDLSTGATRLFIDGVQLGSTIVTTGTRSAAASGIGYIFLGTDRTVSSATDFVFDDLLVANAVTHTTTFTAPTFGQTKYAKSNPTITINSGNQMDGLEGFAASVSATGSNAVKFHLLVNGVAKYWTGAAWGNSDASYAQSNTAAEIHANRASLGITSGATVKVVAVLHSEDGTETVSITSVTLDYNFFVSATTPSECVVYLRFKDFEGVADNDSPKLIVELLQSFWYGENLIESGIKEFTANSSGYIEAQLVETETPNVEYKFSVEYKENGARKTKVLGTGVVPNTNSASVASIVA